MKNFLLILAIGLFFFLYCLVELLTYERHHKIRGNYNYWLALTDVGKFSLICLCITIFFLVFVFPFINTKKK